MEGRAWRLGGTALRSGALQRNGEHKQCRDFRSFSDEIVCKI